MKPDVKLAGVPQTMLWTLYHRAAESMRPDTLLKDEAAEQIYRQIDFSFLHHFGPPDGSIAARACLFDAIVSQWLAQHPDGTVVELGCGLETQNARLDNGQAQWLLVDLPESLAWRQRLVTDHARCRHIAQDCLSLEWMEQIDPDGALMVTVQGLLMYFSQQQVRGLLTAILERFPHVELVFDVIPPWISLWTTSPLGFWKTPFYKVPPMPWGVVPTEVESLLSQWCARPVAVHVQPIRSIRPDVSPWLWLDNMPFLQDQWPAVVHVPAQNRVAG